MNNTIAIIKVKGDMTLPIYLELTDDFKEAISNGYTEVIMDFSDTNLIDSVGISFIIDIIKNTKIRKIKAIKANKMVTASLRAVNLLYILPDAVFNINYFYYPTNSEKQKDIDKFLQTNNIDTDKYYYSLPFNLKSAAFSWKTVYSIEKTYIDTLLQASKNVNLLIKSIEPLSFCAIRYKNTFEQEAYIFEIYKHSANIIMYSPIAGLFKMNLAKEYILDNLKNQNSQI